MSDNEPPSNNPFIRFKQHVDSRIGTGLSVLTGGLNRTEPATASPPSSDCPRPSNANMSSGNPSPAGQPSSWVENLGVGALLDRDPKTKDSRHYWSEWAKLSPYSPYNLRHLNPPVPAGVPEEDAHLFGFEDAFEDLLLATQGQQLMDLRKHAVLKRSARNYFPFEPPGLWVNRLSGSGLLPNPLPPRSGEELPFAFTHDSKVLQGVEAQKERLRMITEQRKKVEQKRGMDDAMASNDDLPAYVKEVREKLLKELDQDITLNPATMVRQAEETMKRMAKEMGIIDPAKIIRHAEAMLESFNQGIKELDPEKMRREFERMTEDTRAAKSDFDLEKFLQSGDAPKAQDQQKAQPDTEEDFFSAIFGALMEADASFKPPRAGAANSPPSKGAEDSAYTESVEEKDNEHGGKTVWYNSQTRFPSGATQQKTIIRTFDAQGKQLSCETKTVEQPPKNMPPKIPGTAEQLKHYQEQLRLLEEHNASARSRMGRAEQGRDFGSGGGNDNDSNGPQTREERVAKPGKSTGWFWS